MATLHIKKGALHRELGIPEGEKIPLSVLRAANKKAKEDGNKLLEKRTQFAMNFRPHHS